MRSIALLLLLVALALAAFAVPAGARVRHDAPRAHCAPLKQEQIRGRSARAVVLQSYHDAWTLIGCSRATGRRHVIARSDRSGQPYLHQVRLRGTRVVWSVGAYASALYAADALRRDARPALIRRVPGNAYISDDFMLGPGGTAVWTEVAGGVASLLVAWPGDVTRTLDQGTALYDLRFTARSVRWEHDIDSRRAPLAPHDVCPAGAARAAGNAALDVLRTAVGAAVCVRSTGATVDLGAAAPQTVVLDGTYAAAWNGPRLLVVNAATGAQRTLATSGTAGPLVVDAHGAVAWADVTRSPAHTTIRADDAEGRHVLWDGDTVIDHLMHDRSEVLFTPTASSTLTTVLMAS